MYQSWLPLAGSDHLICAVEPKTIVRGFDPAELRRGAMNCSEIVFTEALNVSLETYAEMRRRSADDVKAALAELQRYLPTLIAGGEFDRERLVIIEPHASAQTRASPALGQSS